MAQLHFPNTDALRIALASGLIPFDIARSPVASRIDTTGGLWLKSQHDLPGRAYAALQRLGVKAFGTLPENDALEFPCWAALLPLKISRKAAVHDLWLFELPTERLAGFLAMSRKLGARVTGFCSLDRTSAVIVAQPPEYLRMLAESPNEELQSYRPMARNAWCLAGHGTEGLPAGLLDTEGLTLARPEHPWRCLPQADWHTISTGHSLGISTPLSGHAIDRVISFPIRFQLLSRPQGETPEGTLWIAEGGLETLAIHFRDWDERQLKRLEFAHVLVPNGEERILVRMARNARLPAILLAPFRSYSPVSDSQRIFVPSEKRLSPLPKVGVIHRVLGPDAERLTWLEPHGGSFRTGSMSGRGFRSLAEFIRYSVPQTNSLSKSEVPDPIFALPGFVALSESKPHAESASHSRPSKPPNETKPRATSNWIQRLTGRFFPAKKGRVPHSATAIASSVSGNDRLPQNIPNEWAARRKQLESTILAMPPTVADPIRAHAWRELAQLAHTMGHASDASFAWVNAIWYKAPVPIPWLEEWFRAELDSAKIIENTDNAILQRAPSVSIARVCTVRLAILASVEAAGDSQWRRLFGIVQRYSHDLPIRHCWIARHAASALTSGDPLGLARERDAIHGRLAQGGPDADLDSPNFLRYQGKLGAERFHTAADWLRRTRDGAQRWLKSLTGAGRLQWAGLEADLPCTRAYADLLFACGIAKLGDREKSGEWFATAEVTLVKAEGPGVETSVHRYLMERFRLTIRSRRFSESDAPQIPQPLPDFVQKELSRYAVEKLLAQLNVFEQANASDPHGLKGLQSLIPEGEFYVPPDVRQLLAEAAADRTAKHLPPKILLALEFAESSESAREILALLPLALELLPESFREIAPNMEVRLPFVRRGIRAVELACRIAKKRKIPDEFAALCMSLLRSPEEGGDAFREVLRSTSGEVFTACKALGLYAEISELLNGLNPGANTPLVELLPQAIGWFALGEDDRGLKILNDTRRKLFEVGMVSEKERGDLALAYVRTLAHAPPSMIPGRLEELFQRLDRVPVGGAASRYYALRPLEIIGAAIDAVVTEEFALDPAAKAWLADDEFRIRRKICRDLDRALATDTRTPPSP